MKHPTHPSRLRAWCAVLMMGAAAGSPAVSAPMPGEPRLHLGAGTWSGDTTYRVGGRFSMNGESAVLPMPLSELVWPMEVTMVEAGLRLQPFPLWEVRLRGAVSVTDDAGTLEDRDWELPDLLPGTVTTYSESDTALNAEEQELRLSYDAGRLGRGACALRAQVGAGWLRQQADWQSLSGVQYSLFQDEPIVFDREGVITYRTDLDLPYADVGIQVVLKNLALEARCGWSPLARIQDRDDHRARGILAETDADGDGLLVEAAASWSFAPRWSATVSYRRLNLSVDGMSRNLDYAGEESPAGTRWKIHEEIESTQESWTVAVAYRL